MKKKLLILIIILLIISPSFVYAKVVYGDYQEFITNTNEYMEETDTLKREEVRLYNTYKIKKVDLGYKDECINCDMSDTQESVLEFTTKVDGSISFQPVIALKENVSVINLFDFDQKTNIYEINIYDGEKKINYNFFSEVKDKFKYLCDDDESTFAEITLFDHIYISFPKVKAENLKIEIVGEDVSCGVYFSFSGKGSSSSRTKLRANNIYFVTAEEAVDLKEKYGFIVDKYTDASGNLFESINPYYIKNEKKYHCYGEEKVILNNYVKDGDNLIYDDYITLYNYYVRSKTEVVEIDENGQNNQNIEEIVENLEKVENISITKPIINRQKNKKSVKKNLEIDQLTTEEKKSVIENEVLKVEPLFNETAISSNKISIKFIMIIILIIITLQIIIFTLHRKK